MKASTLELIRAPLRSMRRATLAWAVSFALVIVATVAFWPAFKGIDLDAILSQFPPELIQAFGLADFGSPAGYLRGNLYELLVPLLVTAAGILLANGATASDEDGGRLELLLAQPVRRTSVFVARSVAVGFSLVIIGLIVLVAQVLSDNVFDLPIDIGLLTATIVLCMLLAAMHAGLALMVAGFAARPGLVLAVALGVAILGLLVSTLFPLAEALKSLAHLSPWDWALGGDPLVNPTEPWRYLALLVPAVVLAAIGALAFNRRDVGAA